MRGIIVDAYFSEDVDDYIDKVNRPILHLKTISGGELRAPVCSQMLKDYMSWVSNSELRKKIEKYNSLFRNCPNNEDSVKKLMEKL